MKTLLFGACTVAVLGLSVVCLVWKKPLLSLIGSIAAMWLVCGTGYNWKLMLVGSGKTAALLGFERYPAALILLGILAAAAWIVMAVSVIRILRHRRSE